MEPLPTTTTTTDRFPPPPRRRRHAQRSSLSISAPASCFGADATPQLQYDSHTCIAIRETDHTLWGAEGFSQRGSREDLGLSAGFPKLGLPPNKAMKQQHRSFLAKKSPVNMVQTVATICSPEQIMRKWKWTTPVFTHVHAHPLVRSVCTREL